MSRDSATFSTLNQARSELIYMAEKLPHSNARQTLKLIERAMTKERAPLWLAVRELELQNERMREALEDAMPELQALADVAVSQRSRNILKQCKDALAFRTIPMDEGDVPAEESPVAGGERCAGAS